MGRAILAVVVGYIVWTILWIAGGVAIVTAFKDSYDPETYATTEPIPLVITLVLSVVCSVAAGAVARMIRPAPTMSVLVLGAVLLLTGLGVQISAWDSAPVWYHVPFLALLVPVTLFGGSLVKPKPA